MPRFSRRRVPVRMRHMIDALLGFVLTLVMATALLENVAHEYLGVAAIVLVVAHQAVNRAWWHSLARGRYSLRRAAGALVNVMLVAGTLALAGSSIVISTHAFGWLPAITGAWWARTAHLLGSYWLYVCAAVHVGFHVQPLLARLMSTGGARRVAVLTIAALVSAAGAWSFVCLGLPTYLTLGASFVFVDASIPLVLRVMQWSSVAVLFVCVGAVAWWLFGKFGRKGARRAA